MHVYEVNPWSSKTLLFLADHVANVTGSKATIRPLQGWYDTRFLIEVETPLPKEDSTLVHPYLVENKNFSKK